MKDKNSKLIIDIGIPALALVLYTAILFIVAGVRDHSALFWVSYVFMMIAIASSSLCISLLRSRANVPCDWLLAYPFYKHCAIYVTTEFVVSTIFMLMDNKDVAWQISFLIQVIILIVFAVFITSCFAAKEIIEVVQENVKANTSFMKNLLVDVNMIVAKIPDGQDAEVKKAFEELADQIRYSDPVSNDNTVQCEEDLKAQIDKAKVYLTCKDSNGALESCKNAMLLLMERNQRCKLSK